MNKRFDNLIVADGVYVPEIGKTYPEDNPSQSILHTKITRNDVFDENYPYDDHSLRYRFNNFIGYYLFLYPIVFFWNHLKNGLKIKGRDNLKKYKKSFKQGAITICNHCNRMDAPAVLEAVRGNYHTRIPMYNVSFNTPDHWFVWAVGGIPIPEGSITAMKKFNAAFDEFHKRGWWIHVFPESSRWDYYKPLKPFYKGAFSMSYKYNLPIIPCVITFRERKGIYRLFGKPTEPLLTIEVGEPLFPNKDNPRFEEVNRLREAAHKKMQTMAGILQNSWSIAPENE